MLLPGTAPALCRFSEGPSYFWATDRRHSHRGISPKRGGFPWCILAAQHDRRSGSLCRMVTQAPNPPASSTRSVPCSSTANSYSHCDIPSPTSSLTDSPPGYFRVALACSSAWQSLSRTAFPTPVLLLYMQANTIPIRVAQCARNPPSHGSLSLSLPPHYLTPPATQSAPSQSPQLLSCGPLRMQGTGRG